MMCAKIKNPKIFKRRGLFFPLILALPLCFSVHGESPLEKIQKPLGGAVNYTAPGGGSDQTAGHDTGGGLYMRQQNTGGKTEIISLLYNLEAEQEKALEAALKKLSRTHGLFFFFKKSCPYCKDFAPIVAEFAKTYGFDVLGVSRDGGHLPGIRQLPDNGIIATLNPQGLFPGLFLAPYDKSSPPIPLAWGLVSGDDLKENARFILEKIASQNKEWI
jgi:thiol-disulfide isomerase/thioredoxin